MDSVNWKKIKAEYIAGGTSYRKLCEKHGVSRTTLQRKAKDEKWLTLRSQAEAKTETKIVDAISDDATETAVNIIKVADILLNKIAEIAPLVESPTGIKDLASAMKSLKDVKGVKSDADMREQEARIKNLEKQLEKTEESNDITVTIGSDAEEYSG